jgi:hypothetical protein
MNHPVRGRGSNTLIGSRLTYRSEAPTTTTEETNALRITERKTVKQICGPVKQGTRWRIRTNKEINTVTYYKGQILKVFKIPLRWYGHVKRTQNQRIPKQIVTDTMEGTKTRGKPRKRRMDEVEEDSNVMGIRKR